MKSFLKVLSSWRWGNLLEFPSLPAGLSLASGSSWGSWLQSAQDTAMALYFITTVWVKTSWVLNWVLCLAATCSSSKLTSGLSSCLPGVFRQEQAPWWQRWTCVFAMNRASWLSAGYSTPTRSQPNIIQSLRPHLKMFHHHSESKQGLAEPREGKWRKAELWTPSGFSCWCFCIITLGRVRLGARISLQCLLFSQHPYPASVGILAEEPSPETTNAAA